MESSGSDVIGRDWFRLFIPENEQESLRVAFQKLLRTGIPVVHGESPVRRRNGAILYVRWCHVVVRDGEGRITGIVSLGEDISARTAAMNARDVEVRNGRYQQLNEELARTNAALQAAKEKAEKSEDTYRVLYNSLSDALFVAEVNDDFSQGKFIIVNDVACQRLGYTREEMLTMTPADINTELSRKAMSGKLRAKVAHFESGNATPLSFESEHLAKDGRVIPVEINASFIDLGGRRYVYATARDISGRKLAEERERELRAKLERASRMEALGVLAGGVAHDLNNLLGPILILPDMVAEFMKRHAGPADPEFMDAIESLQTIKTSALRAKAVVSDLIVMGRRGQIKKTPVDVNRIVDQMLDSKQVMAMRERWPEVRISGRLEAEPAICMGADASLVRVLVNLVGNAVEAVDGKGEVLLRTGRKELKEPYLGYEPVPAGDYITIEVVDTGCGMDVMTLSHLFEPFFTTKAPSERSGSGLGLSVVYGLVKDHGGFLDCRSDLGKGTTFWIYLPAVSAGAAAMPEEARIKGGHERILVVDDEPGQQVLARQALRNLGYDVTVVSSGEDAVKLYEEGLKDAAQAPFDLVMTDMIMAKMDGIAVCEKVLQLRPGQKMLVCSGQSSEDKEKLALAMGADWLVKPYTAEELSRAVRARLDRTES